MALRVAVAGGLARHPIGAGGYAWVFLDEDSLCWHDRITGTHLGLKKRIANDH